MDVPSAISEEVPFVVVVKRHPTPVIVRLTVRPVNEAIDYVPGQYVLLADAAQERPPRSYSIANAPRADLTLDLLVTLVPTGVVSPWIHHTLQAGDQVLLSGPYGGFVDEPGDSAPRLYLAGGSGLAPVRALAEGLLGRPEPPRATLLFSARTTSDLLDEETFCTWERDHPSFRYARTLTRAAGPPPVGHIPDVLANLLPSLERHRVFVAGSSGFVSASAAAARRHGAAAGRVMTEEFFSDPFAVRRDA